MTQNSEPICQNALDSSDTISEALQKCKGLFPTVAVEIFRKLNKSRLEKLLSQEKNSAEHVTQTLSRSSFVFSNWDFTEEATKLINRKLLRNSSSVCLFGCPTLLPYLTEPQSSNAGHAIFDVDARIPNSKRAQVFNYDINQLRGRELNEQFDGCFIDPPWYLENYLHWIDVARHFAKLDGFIAFSLFGENTRPSAKQDRTKILKYCQKVGLKYEIIPDCLSYKVPTFEHCMLVRANLPTVIWKRSDLVVCYKTRRAPTERLHPPKKIPLVKRFHVGGHCIEVILDRHKGPTQIDSHGDIWLPTPSRRSKIAQRSNVFLSNSAALVSMNPWALVKVLQRSMLLPVNEQTSTLLDLGFPIEAVEFAPYCDIQD